MKRLRILIVAFALVVFGVYAVYRVREAMTSDYVAPVITADSNVIEVSVNATDEELLTGLTASDNLDGDVTSSLVLASKSKFIMKGVRRISYAAFDKNNNVGTYMRELSYTDYISPRFSINQPLVSVKGNSNENFLDNITAYDCLDGDITKQIMITYGEQRAYSDSITAQKVNLQVTNSAGDTSTLEVEFSLEDYNTYSQQAPSLSNYVIYTEKGARPDYASLLNGVWSGGNTRSFESSDFDPAFDVSINDSAVDYNMQGIYRVTYQLSRLLRDATREELGTAVLYVVVEG